MMIMYMINDDKGNDENCICIYTKDNNNNNNKVK